MHRKLLDEHFRIKGREKWYESVEEMQPDLDHYRVRYNNKRPQQGRDIKDRTPYAVFVKGLPKKEKKTIAKKAANAA